MGMPECDPGFGALEGKSLLSFDCNFSPILQSIILSSLPSHNFQIEGTRYRLRGTPVNK